MIDQPDHPDWSLLPHDPVQFFGLIVGFDRRDLKRSYNQFIRRFKPERFPQEFQRIRAAFEQLDSDIRYGQPTDSVGPPVESVEWFAHAAPTSAAQFQFPKRNTPSPALPLYQRIQNGSVSEIYRELMDRSDKSPYDFYSLAVISDVVDRQEGQQFVHWILQGLTAHPNEIGLSRLLHAYFSGPIESEQCESLLIACSKIVREGMFFPLTEPLWRLLLRTQNFSRFRSALRQCEANLKGVNIDSRLAFYLQILKPALWVADSEWISESYNFIEKNYDRIPSFLDYDLEILSRLRTYIEVRESFAQGNEIRDRLDQAIRDYFCEEQVAGDRSVLKCQMLITQDTNGVTAAFPDFSNAAYTPFFAVWNWISHDVGERHIEAPKQMSDESVWRPRIKALLEQISRGTNNSRIGVAWEISRWISFCVRGLCFVASIGLLMLIFYGLLSLDTSRPQLASIPGINQRDSLPEFLRPQQKDFDFEFDPIYVMTTLVSIVFGVLGGYWLQAQFSKRVWLPYCLRISSRCYNTTWRCEVLDFLSRSHINYQTLLAFIRAESGQISKADWVKYYAEQDFAIPMYAIAQRFMV